MSTGGDDLTIRLKIDRSQAHQASQEQKAEFKEVEETAKKSATAQEEAVKKSGGVGSSVAQRFKSEFKDAFQTAGEQSEKFGASVRNLALSAFSIQTITSAMTSYLNAVHTAVDESKRMADEILRIKNNLRELAAMEGVSPTDEFVRQFMDVRKASGLTQDEARQYVTQLQSAGGGTVGRNISDVEWQRFQKIGAQYAATQGGGAEAAGIYGRQAGLLAGVGKYKTAEDLMATQMRAMEIISQGVGQNPILVRQMAEVMGMTLEETGGYFGSPAQLAAVVSTASRVSPRRAADIIRQTTHVLRGFQEKWSPLLKQAKITPEMQGPEAIEHLFGEIEKAQKQGVAPDIFLAQQGVPTEAAQQIQALYTYRGTMAKFMGMARAPVMSSTQAQAELQRRFALPEGLDLRVRQEQAGKEAADMRQQQQMQYERLIEAEADRRLAERGQGVGKPGAASQDWWRGAQEGGFLPGFPGNAELGRRIRQEEEMYRITQEHGIKVPGRPSLEGPAGHIPYINWLMSGQAEQAYAGAGEELSWQGWRPSREGGGGPPADVQRRQLEEQQKQTKHLQDLKNHRPKAMTRVKPGGTH